MNTTAISAQKLEKAFAAKLVAAGCLCGAIVFVPGLPAAVAACLAAGGFIVLAWVSGAVPRDPVDALLALRRRA